MFHCSVIKVPVILATAILDYHNQEGLSRTFLFFWNFFLKLFPLISVFFDSQSRLSHLTRLVKNFFKVFLTSFFDNFRYQRRKRDLNPRTARTVYTLSRGASSATWVFLQRLNNFLIHLCSAWALLIITPYSSICQSLFLFFLTFFFPASNTMRITCFFLLFAGSSHSV